MEIGTFKTNRESEQKQKKRNRLSSVSGSGKNDGKNSGGGGNDGNNGNDENLNSDAYEITEPNPSEKLRVGMWFVLVVVLMTFGGLISAYIVIANNGVIEWRPFNLPKQVWLSTILIIASSLTYHISKRAIHADNQEKSKNWLLATTVLGAAFISSQILAWIALVQRGVYVQSNPYAGFFYILTAVHALHVLGGIIALGFMVLRTWHQTNSEKELEQRKSFATTIGWYWHFMDALWIVLFVLLGFWK